MLANQTPTSISHRELYEQDFCLWVEQAVQLLSENRLSELDRENLIEEIGDMGRSEKLSLESNLEVVLMHLLKYQYQSEKRTNSWRYTIIEHRQRIHKAFRNSPSLKRHFVEEFDNCYIAARELAATETGLDIQLFPPESPFTPDQVLDKTYLPT